MRSHHEFHRLFIKTLLRNRNIIFIYDSSFILFSFLTRNVTRVGYLTRRQTSELFLVHIQDKIFKQEKLREREENENKKDWQVKISRKRRISYTGA